MVRRLIFTIILVIIGISFSCMGVKPEGPFASLQDQENTEKQASARSNSVADTSAGSAPVSESEDESEIADTEKEDSKIKSIFVKIVPKRIQLSLTEKSNQILETWSNQQSVHGIIKVLQTADYGAATGALSVKPGEVLAPYDSIHKVVSFLFLAALWVITFGKTAVSVSVPIICLVIIPIVIIINIIALWKNKDNAKAHRILFAAILTTVLIAIAVPVVMKISILADDYIFSKRVNAIMVSLEDSGLVAGVIDADLRSGKKSNAEIQNHIAAAKRLSNAVVRDSFAYFLIFAICFVLVPVFSGIGLYKLTRFTSGIILKR